MLIQFSSSLVAILVAALFADPKVESSLNTLSTEYSVTHSVQVNGGPEQESNSESGSFIYDAQNCRASFQKTQLLPNGEKWLVHDLFDEDTSLNIMSRTPLVVAPANAKQDHPDVPAKIPSRSEAVLVSGRAKQTTHDWAAFLGNRSLSVAVGYVVCGKQGYQIEELLKRGTKSSEAATNTGEIEYTVDSYRIYVLRDPAHGNAISKLRWSSSVPLADEKGFGNVNAGKYEVEQFEMISGVWIPVSYTTTKSMSGGVVKLPEGLRLGKATTEAQVPAKIFKTKVHLVNPRVNEPLEKSNFAATVDNGYPATNIDARQIRHVVWDNKLIPEVDAVASGLIEKASPQPPGAP